MLNTFLTTGRVLITGGGSGLGAAVADKIEDAGGTPIILDQDVTGVGQRLAYSADVADTRGVEACVRRITADMNGLDAIITAAGIDRCGRLDDISGQDWDRVIAVNLLGTAAVIRAGLSGLKRSHGRVVTIASSLALRALPHASAYCASKFGVLGLSRALAAETKGEIGVTTLIPAGMDTSFFDDRQEQYRPGPDAELNDPSLVADAVIFALQQPRGCEVRELVICHENEPSWP